MLPTPEANAHRALYGQIEVWIYTHLILIQRSNEQTEQAFLHTSTSNVAFCRRETHEHNISTVKHFRHRKQDDTINLRVVP